jgi:hypothetical protein
MSKPTKELIARTGRVQSWIDDPTSRLPVSCTVFVVEDTMEGPNGIEASYVILISTTLTCLSLSVLVGLIYLGSSVASTLTNTGGMKPPKK